MPTAPSAPTRQRLTRWGTSANSAAQPTPRHRGTVPPNRNVIASAVGRTASARAVSDRRRSAASCLIRRDRARRVIEDHLCSTAHLGVFPRAQSPWRTHGSRNVEPDFRIILHRKDPNLASAVARTWGFGCPRPRPARTCSRRPRPRVLGYSAMVQVLERLGCHAIGKTQRDGSSNPI